MKILASWQKWQAGKRAKQRAKAQSTRVDRWLMEESNRCQGQQDVLFICSCTPGSEREACDFVRRMKTIDGGYTDEALAEFRQLIWKNLLENSRDIVHALRKLNLDHANRSTEANCEYIMNHRNDTNDPDFVFLPGFAEVVQDLWTEEILPLLDNPSAFCLADNAEYFFSEAQRIVTEDYVPSMEDIQHFSQKGIVKTHFNFGRQTIRVLQIHSQQSYSRKWIHLFEGATSLMFHVSLSDYDEPSGASQQTRLVESLSLFETFVNSYWFRRSSVLLFLTGIREFTAKIHEVPLNAYFPEYTGGADGNKGVKYILFRFMSLNRLRISVYPMIIDVPDMSCTRQMAIAVRETILANALKDCRPRW